jgi:UDP-3-O-[3-hydroxymyristoyl] glucosamine N-acyltransferase
MIDHRFFKCRGPFALSDVVQISDVKDFKKASHVRDDTLVHDLAPLQEAKENHLSMLHNPKYVEDFQKSKAGFCFVTPDLVEKAPSSMTLLITTQPYRSYAKIAQAFYPEAESDFSSFQGAIHPSAKIERNCIIEYGAVIQENVEIGEGTKIGANAVIGKGVVIGKNCLIGAGVKVFFSLVGDNVVIYPGACIGQAGFGFFMDEQGHVKVPQLGRVIIEKNVEIGSNTAIDRGSLDDTVIGQGSRLDNLVQIAHNVKLGKGCVIVSQVGIAGSTHLGDYVIAAGQAGLTGHLKIGSRARIAAQSGVMRNINDGETVAGSPAVSVTQWHRQTVALTKLINKSKKKD